MDSKNESGVAACTLHAFAVFKVLTAQNPATAEISEPMKSNANAFGTRRSVVVAAVVAAQACDQSIGLGER